MSCSRRILFILLDNSIQKLFFVLIKLGEFLGRISNSSFKIISCPLNSVLNLIREVLQGAKRDRFLWRVNNVSIALSVVWNNNLRVAFSTKGSTFEQRLFIPYALEINILPRFNIIDGIDDKV